MCDNCGIENCNCGIIVPKGDAGDSSQLYIAYANDANGNGFSLTDGSLPFMAFLAGDPLLVPVQADFAGLWFAKGQGAFGGNSDQFLFNDSTSAGDPGSGKILFNSSNVQAVTNIYVSRYDNPGAKDILTWLAGIGASTNPVKSYIRIFNKANPTKFVLYKVTAYTANATWVVLAITYLASSSNTPFLLNDEIVLSYSVAGDKGDPGSDASNVLFNNLTAPNSGNTGGVTTLLLGQNIPANTFANNGDVVEVLIIATTDATAFFNSPSVTPRAVFKVNGVTLTAWALFFNGVAVVARLTISRLNSTTIRIIGTIVDGQNSQWAITYDLGGINFTTAIPVQIFANTVSANNGGIICTQLFGEYKAI